MHIINWIPDKNKPLCPQICDRICVQIALGQLVPDEKLPSIRESAIIYGINPNTVQRAMEILERDGVIYSIRGSGWYVGKDVSKSQEILEASRREKTELFIKEMENLGFSKNDLYNYVKEMIQ